MLHRSANNPGVGISKCFKLCQYITHRSQDQIPHSNSHVCLHLTAPFVHKALQPNQEKLQVNIYEYIIQHNEAQINEKLDQIE